MQSENGLLIDVGQIRHVLENADVFAIGFANFAERLLVDTRRNDDIGPMVRVVEPLASVQERYFWLGRERPSFGAPQGFAFFAWPHSIGFLEQSGIWERIHERTGAATDAAAALQCDNSLEDLKALERVAIQDAIRGRRYVSLWPQQSENPAS
jgi:hypothetical protein